MKLKEWFEQNQDKEIEFHDGKITVKEPEVKGRWEPQPRERYYSICREGQTFTLHRLSYLDVDDSYPSRLAIGNVFRTKEEAEFARERLKIRAEMLDLGGREYFKPNEVNNYISYNHDTGKLVLDGGSSFQDPFVIYFDRDISLTSVIKKIGESRIKKYLFGVDDEEDEE